MTAPTIVPTPLNTIGNAPIGEGTGFGLKLTTFPGPETGFGTICQLGYGNIGAAPARVTETAGVFDVLFFGGLTTTTSSKTGAVAGVFIKPGAGLPTESGVNPKASLNITGLLKANANGLQSSVASPNGSIW
jgi:hypothetical protein